MKRSTESQRERCLAVFACKDDIIRCTCSCIAAASFLLFNEKMEYLQASTGAQCFFFYLERWVCKRHIKYICKIKLCVPIQCLCLHWTKHSLSAQHRNAAKKKRVITQEARKEYHLLHPLSIYPSISCMAFRSRLALYIYYCDHNFYYDDVDYDFSFHYSCCSIFTFASESIAKGV